MPAFRCAGISNIDAENLRLYLIKDNLCLEAKYSRRSNLDTNILSVFVTRGSLHLDATWQFASEC